MNRSGAAALLVIAMVGVLATACTTAPVSGQAGSSAATTATHINSSADPTAGTSTASLSAARSAVQKVSPLAAGRFVTCAGTLISSSFLAMAGGVETTNTPAAQALRAFIRNNPGGFLTADTSQNWSLIFSSPVRAVFGHKIGLVGVDHVVSFNRSAGGAFTMDASTGCSGPIPTTNETSAPIVYASVTSTAVVLHWLNSACASGAPPDKILVKVEQIVVTSRVHLLVVVRANPDVAAGPQSCGGVAVDSIATTNLKSPIDAKALNDDYGIPASLISVHA